MTLHETVKDFKQGRVYKYNNNTGYTSFSPLGIFDKGGHEDLKRINEFQEGDEFLLLDNPIFLEGLEVYDFHILGCNREFMGWAGFGVSSIKNLEEILPEEP